ncbi:MAG: hypothetical protein J5I93_00020, partial [Pirellulaceae bacterium]|nr:hypothetical protein [Pirellulaceae bacterium]
DVRGIVVSRQPAAAACLANRSPVLRAIAGTDPQLVREAIASWAPNVLVLPAGVERLAEIVEPFLQAGGQTCPPPWKLWFDTAGRS